MIDDELSEPLDLSNYGMDTYLIKLKRVHKAAERYYAGTSSQGHKILHEPKCGCCECEMYEALEAMKRFG